MIKQMKGMTTGGERVRMIPVSEIEQGRYDPRRKGADADITRLKDSIHRHGILVPLTVRPSERGFGYTLISGSRRLRAAAELGRKSVPCIVLPADDKLCAEFALIESMQRRELDMFEQAEAIARLIGEVGLTREEAAAQLSCTVGCVSNKLRLLRLSDRERELIRRASLSERHARAALRISDSAARYKAIREMSVKGMTVACAEEYVESIVAASIAAAPDPISRRESRIRQIRDSAALPARAVGADRVRYETGVRLLAQTLASSADTLRRAGFSADITRSDAPDSASFTVTVGLQTQASMLAAKS